MPVQLGLALLVETSSEALRHDSPHCHPYLFDVVDTWAELVCLCDSNLGPFTRYECIIYTYSSTTRTSSLNFVCCSVLANCCFLAMLLLLQCLGSSIVRVPSSALGWVRLAAGSAHKAFVQRHGELVDGWTGQWAARIFSVKLCIRR